MNWPEIWPQVVAGVLVASLSGLTIYLGRQLAAIRRQLGESKSLARRLKKIGLSNFYESRDDYAKFRGAPRLADYLAFANRRIIIAGYWLAQGSEMEGVTEDLRKLLEQRENLRITVIVIDPDAAYVPAIASQMKLPMAAVRARAIDSLRGLVELKSSLSSNKKEHLDIRIHASIPFASLIAIDPESETDGRVQFDFKLYGSPRSNSIGFEVRSNKSQVAKSLIQTCEQICRDAPVVNTFDYEN